MNRHPVLKPGDPCEFLDLVVGEQIHDGVRSYVNFHVWSPATFLGVASTPSAPLRCLILTRDGLELYSSDVVTLDEPTKATRILECENPAHVFRVSPALCSSCVVVPVLEVTEEDQCV